jgi:CO/xanthine dehydrogenase FAD-binding subunit
VRDAHIGVIGACNQPQRLRKVEVLLNGRAVDEDLIREAAAAAAHYYTAVSDPVISGCYSG